MMQRTLIQSIELFIYYALKIIIVFGAFFALVQGQWIDLVVISLILFLTFLPRLVKNRYQLFFPLEFDLFLVVFIFCTLFLGEVHNYYTVFPWWDLYLHSISGFWFGVFGFLLVYILNTRKKMSGAQVKPFFVALFAFSFSVLCGTVWEIFEFSMDSFFSLTMQEGSLSDTMWDLIVDTIGAFSISLLGYLWMKKRVRFFVFDHSISQFVEKNPRLFTKRR
ncbi:MAG: hypothetical protein HN726_03555 [Candidatus Magasanikbacteria bacterium]|nr:hypothetical protein [Candidatus Magasanikbacteria bacterium]MBT4221367.1 hypothetical protein [Candidatus Magasanikbacteria bacterium]MBT4350785.1 hypothetical protein [Candidatus Magasanikbacteria bacterium]MBT4541539.1 hypothetical protein [Candidatus Magasanikbacteria bacterium]MBT6253491.1 hypothetical protein [Candidatus Magasanikbacteria bacterium]